MGTSMARTVQNSGLICGVSRKGKVSMNRGRLKSRGAATAEEGEDWLKPCRINAASEAEKKAVPRERNIQSIALSLNVQ